MTKEPVTKDAGVAVRHSSFVIPSSFVIGHSSFVSVRAVLFDASGTLIFPNPPVAEVYASAGRRFESRLTEDEIAARFAAALAKQDVDEAAAVDVENEVRGRVHSQLVRRATNQPRERRRWQRIVADVFDDVRDADGALFELLWDHFAHSRHWSLYDDVTETWCELERRGLTLGIASNFDDRLSSICCEIEPLSRCPHVFWSAGLGYSKPSTEFFRSIERQLQLPAAQILLVGDDDLNDYLGARTAGWQALLLNRAGGEPCDGTIRTLRELPSLLAAS